MNPVPGFVTPNTIAAWSDQLAESEALVLRLDEPVTTDLLVESHLVGLFAQAAFLGRSVDVVLSDTFSIESLRDTSFGAILVSQSRRITDATGSTIEGSLRQQLRADLVTHNGVIGSAGTFLLPVFDSVGTPFTAHPILTNPDPEIFGSSAQLLLESLLRGAAQSSVRFLSQFIYEMWLNTIDHALDDLNGKPLQGMRAIVIKSRPLATSLRGGAPLVQEFLASLQARFESTIESLLEVTVVDSGVGVGARITRNPNFVELDERAQVQFVQQAMESGNSSKKRPGSGLGYTKIFRVLDRVRGLLLLNTGGLSAGKMYLPPCAEWPSERLYAASVARRGILKGTAVSLLVPTTGPSRV